MRKRVYKHKEAKTNKEVEIIGKRIDIVLTEAQKQRSVIAQDNVSDKVKENIFYIDKDGNVYIRTKLGLKQLQFV